MNVMKWPMLRWKGSTIYLNIFSNGGFGLVQNNSLKLLHILHIYLHNLCDFRELFHPCKYINKTKGLFTFRLNHMNWFLNH